MVLIWNPGQVFIPNLFNLVMLFLIVEKHNFSKLLFGMCNLNPSSS